MNKRDKIDGNRFYYAMLSGYIYLRKDRGYINKINVFPVPDGDTGTNMETTIGAVIKSVEQKASLSHVLNNAASVSLRSARGNSGIIISQFLGGLAKEVGLRDSLNIESFALATSRAVDYTYKSMETPVEGSILTVLRSWSDSLLSNSRIHNSIESIFYQSYNIAKSALVKTTEQMEILRINKVVDAGAKGFVSFLDGLNSSIKNKTLLSSLKKKLHINSETIVEEVPIHLSTSEDLKDRYCTELFLENVKLEADVIRSSISNMGKSLIVAKNHNSIRVHIHTANPSEIVKVLSLYGKITEQKVDDMVRQYDTSHRRVSDIAIVTDSIADIPQNLKDKFQIHVIPQNILWDEDEYIDRITITPGDFYEMQKRRDSFPSSSIPSPAYIKKYLTNLLISYSSVLVLPVGKKLSGTWQIMENCSKDLREEGFKIEVIDTCLNSAAQGLLVLESAIIASNNSNFENLVKNVLKIKERSRIFVSVKTFKYMVKGGRISKLKGLIANILNLKPIISLDKEGKGLAFEKAFSQRGLMKKIGQIVSNIDKGNGIDKYIIVHADDLNRSSLFTQQIISEIGKEPEYIMNISPIVGMHAGKGAVAIGILEKEPV